MKLGRLYQLYLLIACEQFLKNILRTVLIQLGGKGKDCFRCELDIRSAVDELSVVMYSTRRFTFSFKYAPNGWYYVFIGPSCFRKFICS